VGPGSGEKKVSNESLRRSRAAAGLSAISSLRSGLSRCRLHRRTGRSSIRTVGHRIIHRDGDRRQRPTSPADCSTCSAEPSQAARGRYRRHSGLAAGIVQYPPRQRVIALADTEKGAERHHRTRDAAGVFVHHKPIDRAEMLTLKVVDRRRHHLVGRNEPACFFNGDRAACRRCCVVSHDCTCNSWRRVFPADSARLKLTTEWSAGGSQTPGFLSILPRDHRSAKRARAHSLLLACCQPDVHRPGQTAMRGCQPADPLGQLSKRGVAVESESQQCRVPAKRQQLVRP
jgi:hypothetical protein